ncbi:MAG: M28 family peptidase [Gemmatimonadales bacterium]|nr:M28 family peptidase [Gemmatimonadales bacterium]
MTRSALMGFLTLAAACRGGSSQASQRFDGAQAMRWVVHQVAAGPRVPGTVGHRTIGEWIEAELRRTADSVEVQAFDHVTAGGDTLHLRNIIARFRPQDPNRVLYVTHWDTRPTADQESDPARRNLPIPGANDGASGVAVMLGVAAELKVRPPTLGVDIVFVDGEDYGSFEGEDALIGSRYFARHLPQGYRPLFAVVWDMVGDRDQRFEQEGYSLDRAPEVVERVWRTAEEIGLGRVFRPRRGIALTDDHIPLLEAGIRAINVIDFDYQPYWHTTQDTPDKLSAESLANVGRLALALVR